MRDSLKSTQQFICTPHAVDSFFFGRLGEVPFCSQFIICWGVYTLPYIEQLKLYWIQTGKDPTDSWKSFSEASKKAHSKRPEKGSMCRVCLCVNTERCQRYFVWLEAFMIWVGRYLHVRFQCTDMSIDRNVRLHAVHTDIPTYVLVYLTQVCTCLPSAILIRFFRCSTITMCIYSCCGVFPRTFSLCELHFIMCIHQCQCIHIYVLYIYIYSHTCIACHPAVFLSYSSLLSSII